MVLDLILNCRILFFSEICHFVVLIISTIMLFEVFSSSTNLHILYCTYNVLCSLLINLDLKYNNIIRIKLTLASSNSNTLSVHILHRLIMALYKLHILYKSNSCLFACLRLFVHFCRHSANMLLTNYYLIYNFLLKFC
jgi:hypothetical protein